MAEAGAADDPALAPLGSGSVDREGLASLLAPSYLPLAGYNLASINHLSFQQHSGY
jgi:hypothetical protein